MDDLGKVSVYKWLITVLVLVTQTNTDNNGSLGWTGCVGLQVAD